MKKLPLFIISLSMIVSMVNPISAALPQPESNIPSLEHYHSNDPCFDQVRGYLCEIRIPATESNYSKEELRVKQIHDRQIEVYLW